MCSIFKKLLGLSSRFYSSNSEGDEGNGSPCLTVVKDLNKGDHHQNIRYALRRYEKFLTRKNSYTYDWVLKDSKRGLRCVEPTKSSYKGLLCNRSNNKFTKSSLFFDVLQLLKT